MIKFIANIHNRRPILWTVIAFIFVVAMAATLSVWWNYLLFQNHRILRTMTAAAQERNDVPLALLMFLGLACSILLVLGLVYLFLRLIRSVQLNLAQSQFIAAVTHELRSPVASLQLLLDTIRDPTTPEDVRYEFERNMNEDLKRLRVLVDQVLDTARLENLGTTLRERVSIVSVFEQCTEMLETRLKMNAGQLNIERFSPELAVTANPRLLTSALLNILDNAVKYSNGSAEINLSVIEKDTKVVILVRDRGVGIGSKELKRVFKRFYRGGDPTAQNKPGTGLGLYFARLAIRAQGGNISVTSPGFGLGSTFQIEVPKA